MTLIKASITAGIRPTSMILHTQPSGKWNDLDFLIMEAYEIYKSEMCPECGYPIYVCHNDSNDIKFRLAEVTCYGKAAVDKRNKANSKKKGFEPPAGTTLRPEPYSKTGADLTSYREQFYLDLMAKRKAIRAAS